MIRAALVAGLAGAAALGLEILASRWLAPAFGFTLETWSVLIAATLLAGAGGAALGGVGAADPSGPRLAALLASAGFWMAAAAFLAPALMESLIALPLLTGTAIAAAIVVMPPGLALGAVVPTLVARSRTRPVGPREVGILIAASTAGSLAGTLVTALVLVPRAGLRASTLAFAALLIVSAGVVVRHRGRRLIGLLFALALLSAAAAGGPEDSAARIVRETPYGKLTLERSPTGLSISVNGIPQAHVPAGPISPGELVALRQHIGLLPYIRPQGTRALEIGLGGGLLARGLEAHAIEVVTVEIDAILVDCVRRHLGFDGRVIVGDGRAVIRRSADRYDFVILDAFCGEAIPTHLLSLEAFGEARRILTSGGIVAVHLIGRPAHAAIATVARTLGAVFARTLATKNGAGDDLQDICLFATDGPLSVPPHPELDAALWSGDTIFTPDLRSGVVATDDLNPLESLFAPLSREWRRHVLQPLK